MIGLGPCIEVLQEIIQQVGIGLTKGGVGIEDNGLELHQEKEGMDQGLDPVPVLVQIGTSQDAIDAMNMTTSLENVLMLCWMRNY